MAKKCLVEVKTSGYPDEKEKASKSLKSSRLVSKDTSLVRLSLGRLRPRRACLRFTEQVKHKQKSVSVKRIALISLGLTNWFSPYSRVLFCQKNGTSSVDELLPRILEDIRAHSISRRAGWRFEVVDAGNGDFGLCAICCNPYQHFEHTVKVRCLDMRPNAFHGVCRECVRQFAPLEFVESDGVEEWLRRNRDVCERVEKDHKREGQRIDLIEAIRKHAHSTHYFGDIVRNAPEWAKGASGEWR